MVGFGVYNGDEAKKVVCLSRNCGTVYYPSSSEYRGFASGNASCSDVGGLCRSLDCSITHGHRFVRENPAAMGEKTVGYHADDRTETPVTILFEYCLDLLGVGHGGKA